MSKVPSSPVRAEIRATVTWDMVDTMAYLTEEAVRRAIENTISDIANFALGEGSQVPVKTGRLISSFDIRSTGKSIIFGWSAVDPQTGYDYAKIQDEGGPAGPGGSGYISPNYFSYVVKEFGRGRLLAHLQAELRAVLEAAQ